MFSNELIKLRKEKGLTQQELADKLGLSRSAIGMYEKGNREPNFETLELIADFFNVRMERLIGKNPYDFGNTDFQNNVNAKSKTHLDLIQLINNLTDEQAQQALDYIDYLISKRNQ